MPHPMPMFGVFSLLLALVLAAYSLVVGSLSLWAISTNRPLAIAPEVLRESARRAGLASFIAVACAAFALIWAAFTNDYSVDYILHHTTALFLGTTSSPRSGQVRKARFSSGHSSSLPTASLCACSTRATSRSTPTPRPSLAGVQVFFLTLIVVPASPFALVPGGVAPADGFGLNPLLQYPEMAIHPPMLYLGYVGFTIPFASLSAPS